MKKPSWKSKNKPVIGLTMGDPKGVGPEVIRKALASPWVKKNCSPVVFGDPSFFNWKDAASLTHRQCGTMAAHCIRQAAFAALRGEIDAVVTGPISKENLRKAGERFPGHTEFLAELSGVRTPHNEIRMMMAGPKLKVVLVTIHEALRSVPSLLTVRSIFRTIEIADRSLKGLFRIRRPRIAVAALNPHAGEGGMFGLEERKIIVPAIHAALRQKINVAGPFPPDTVFRRAAMGDFDAVVSMYHDQGLIPLKLLHFEEAVNITLGLPFIRTSVDHGTAFDIAGKGVADPGSMIAAIRMAVGLVKRIS